MRRERGDLEGTYEAMSGDCAVAADTLKMDQEDLPCWRWEMGQGKTVGGLLKRV